MIGMKAAFFSISCTVLLLAAYTVEARANGAICLLDSTDIEIRNNYTAVMKVNKILRITSDEGAGFAELAVPVNDFIEIKDIKGYTVLPDGRRIRIKSSDIRTATAAEVSEFGGYRVVLISLRSPVIGAIFNYRYTLKIKSLLYLPRIVRTEAYAIERFAVRVRWKRNIILRFDYTGMEAIRSERETRFIAENLSPFPSEPNMCPDDFYLVISADQFRYKKGRYYSRSWADVGRFYASRARQSGESLDEVRRLARRIIGESNSRLDSIQAIFNFVADSVSYVALELGKSDFDPHVCELIIERRFGDCKDQSILLSSLYREVGIDAHPALVATGSGPAPMGINPWPALFDHSVVVIKDSAGDLILDPSDPRSTVGLIPPRLRRKSYLVADGNSGLRTVPESRWPSLGLSWEFGVEADSGGEFRSGFETKYINDASANFPHPSNIEESRELTDHFDGLIQDAGWQISFIDIDSIVIEPDSLTVAGRMTVSAGNIGAGTGLSVGSPIVTYLLENIFTGSRESDYCGPGTLHLEEFVRVAMTDIAVDGLTEHDEIWVRNGLEFSDQLTLKNGNLLYRRVYNADGSSIRADDFNEFRDILLSLRNQRYLEIVK
jgi:hypothetical protein